MGSTASTSEARGAISGPGVARPASAPVSAAVFSDQDIGQRVGPAATGSSVAVVPPRQCLGDVSAFLAMHEVASRSSQSTRRAAAACAYGVRDGQVRDDGFRRVMAHRMIVADGAR